MPLICNEENTPMNLSKDDITRKRLFFNYEYTRIANLVNTIFAVNSFIQTAIYFQVKTNLSDKMNISFLHLASRRFILKHVLSTMYDRCSSSLLNNYSNGLASPRAIGKSSPGKGEGCDRRQSILLNAVWGVHWDTRARTGSDRRRKERKMGRKMGDEDYQSTIHESRRRSRYRPRYNGRKLPAICVIVKRPVWLTTNAIVNNSSLWRLFIRSHAKGESRHEVFPVNPKHGNVYRCVYIKRVHLHS